MMVTKIFLFHSTGGFLLFQRLGFQQFFPKHFKIAQAELQVGLKMVAFRPFVPGLDEYDPVLPWDIAHPVKGFSQMASE
jgi:hypothetical protein